MKIRSRWIVIAVGVLAIGGIAGMTLVGSPVEVDTAIVSRTGLSMLVSEDGHTRVRNRYVVTAPATGLLARIELTAGDDVEEGTVLATLFAAPSAPRNADVADAEISAAEAQRDQAAAQVQELETALAQAVQQADRTQRLADTSSVSTAALERAQLAVVSAQRQLDAGRAAVRAAEANLAALRAALLGVDYITLSDRGVEVTAPAIGKVLRILEGDQRVVTAGTPLIEIGDTTELEVVVAVLSEDAVRIRNGFPVQITEWGGEGTLDARVIRVEPDAFSQTSALGVQEQRVNIIASLIDPPAELGSGYRVQANIVIWSDEEAVTVPTSALFQRMGEWHVFAIVEGRASLTQVEIGHRSAQNAQVLGGLPDGSRVIVFPSEEIADGVDVAPSGDAA
jgi:HlyD family secretion protein